VIFTTTNNQQTFNFCDVASTPRESATQVLVQHLGARVAFMPLVLRGTSLTQPGSLHIARLPCSFFFQTLWVVQPSQLESGDTCPISIVHVIPFFYRRVGCQSSMCLDFKAQRAPLRFFGCWFCAGSVWSLSTADRGRWKIEPGE
jgi:hypothetical protein